MNTEKDKTKKKTNNKRRTIAEFGDVGAKIDVEEIPLTKEEIERQQIIDLSNKATFGSVDPGIDAIDSKLNRPPFKETHTQRGLYIRNDLDKVLTKYSDRGGHGMKTIIVNAALETLFKEKGWEW